MTAPAEPFLAAVAAAGIRFVTRFQVELGGIRCVPEQAGSGDPTGFSLAPP